jgi:hypothetical protein
MMYPLTRRFRSPPTRRQPAEPVEARGQPHRHRLRPDGYAADTTEAARRFGPPTRRPLRRFDRNKARPGEVDCGIWRSVIVGADQEGRRHVIEILRLCPVAPLPSAAQCIARLGSGRGAPQGLPTRRNTRRHRRARQARRPPVDGPPADVSCTWRHNHAAWVFNRPATIVGTARSYGRVKYHCVGQIFSAAPL